MKRSGIRGFSIAVGVSLAFGLWLTAWSQNTTPPVPTAAAALPPDAPKPPYRRVTGPETLNPGDYPEHFPYPDEYDSAVGAAEVHHIRYIDSHVRFVEVAYFPGVHGQMHGHPWFSVFAVDAPVPKAYNLQLDPDRPPHRSAGTSPQGMPFPTCATMNPQPPHAETNLDTWPHHFYRLEFLRIDGKDFQDHWKEWYPNLAEPAAAVKNVKAPANAPKLSEQWPYPASEDSYKAAPSDNRLLYEDPHVRLIEVSIRPGETETMNGNPYPSVLAMDSIPDPGVAKDLVAAQGMGQGAAPRDFAYPTCATTGPEAPHAFHNAGSVPVHFYRIEFKRIDGDDLKTNWRVWYPWMAKITDEYKVHPYVSNYY
jgi:hypothetical protein